METKMENGHEYKLKLKSSIFLYKMVMSLLSHIIEKFCTKRANWTSRLNEWIERKWSKALKYRETTANISDLFYFVLFLFALPSFSWSLSLLLALLNWLATRSFVTLDFILIIGSTSYMRMVEPKENKRNENKKRLHAYHPKTFSTRCKALAILLLPLNCPTNWI